MLIFIALFVYMAAAGEAQMTSMSEAARDLRVADAMETRIATIDRAATVAEAVDTLLATSQDDFPLVDSAGRLQGLLTRTEIIGALRGAEANAPVAPFARRQVPVIGAEATIGGALTELNAGASVGVVDAEGRLVGLLTRQSLAEIMMIRDARPDWRFSRRRETPPTVA